MKSECTASIDDTMTGKAKASTISVNLTGTREAA